MILEAARKHIPFGQAPAAQARIVAAPLGQNVRIAGAEAHYNKYMLRPARSSSRILCCLLALLLLAQLGLMGAAQPAQPQWLEVCSAAGTRYVPTDDAQSAAPGHEDGTHCPACPVGQHAALLVAPAGPVFRAQYAGAVPHAPAPLLRTALRWQPSLPRGPPLPA